MPRSARVATKNAPLKEATASINTSNKETHTMNPSKPRTALERRRQVHLRCEHRRRKEIQDALDALEAELPQTFKPRSKNAIIVDSAEYIQQLTLTLDRLVQENQQLRQAAM